MLCRYADFDYDWNFVSTEQMVPKQLKLPQCAFFMLLPQQQHDRVAQSQTPIVCDILE